MPIVYLFLASVLFTLAGCSGPSSATVVERPAPAPAKDTGAPTVAFVKPKLERMSRGVSLSGEFRPYQVVDLHAKVAGYLKSITVDVGSTVKQGQAIAVLEIPEMDAELASASAERHRTVAELTRANAELERANANLTLVSLSHKRLGRGGEGRARYHRAAGDRRSHRAQECSRSAGLLAKATLTVEEQRIAGATAAERRIQAMAAYSQISAPFSGVVTKRYADPGAMIQAGTASQTQAMPVIRLAEISRLRLAVNVPESAVPLVRPGLRVEMHVPSINRTITGVVARLNRDVSSASRTMEAEIDVANPGSLTPGMFADINIKLDKPVDSMTVPVGAVINGGGNRSVYTVNASNQVEERTIQTGFESASGYEVLSGLTTDDRIIISNRSLLKPGQNVTARAAQEN
jgi:RND family efflux transporter MFP subunit